MRSAMQRAFVPQTERQPDRWVKGRMVDMRSDDGVQREGAPVMEHVVVRHGRSPLFWISLLVLGVLTAVLIAAWIARRPIAEHFIEQELSRRGVRSTMPGLPGPTSTW